MCGRYTLTGANPGQLRERFALAPAVPLRPRFNVAPGQDVVAVTAGPGAVEGGELLRWGLVPHWAKDPKIGSRLINARAESVAERPAFRDALARRRCLILADGFYEWQPRAYGPKQPWWITHPDHEPFAFAGLWAAWRPADDVEPVRTCTIITTQAAAAVRDVHGRMPVLLPAAAEAGWLDPEMPVEALLALLVPDERVVRIPVSRGVNDVHHDAPELIVPVEPGPDEPAAPPLF